MQKAVQYIYLYFTKDDQDILSWANMIKENNLNLSTWIQGILVSEAAREKLDIGAVYVQPVQVPNKKRATSSLWGDDTEDTKENKKTSGWHVRGENGKLIVGTVLPIKITRPIAQEALTELKKKHKRIAAYVKAVIRQNLILLPTGPNLPPKKTDVIDLFVLCEGKIGRNNSNNHSFKNKNNQSGQKKEDQAPEKTQTQQQKQGELQKESEKKSFSHKSVQSTPDQTQQNKQHQVPIRNPLLNQID